MGGAEKVIISINSLLVLPLLAPTLWGMFSRRIGLKEMCIVTLTSFIIGGILRFGLSIQSNDIDILVGVLFPILLLILLEYLGKNKLTWEESWYIGNDVNDLGAINKAKFSLCPSDAVERVINSVDYVLKTKGGFGILSEIVTELEKTN
jgi:hypothetical protein